MPENNATRHEISDEAKAAISMAKLVAAADCFYVLKRN